jgi:HK97 family phage portal protein
MNWFKRSPEKRAHVEQGNGTSWLANILQLLSGPKSSSGVYINEQKALTIAAVYTCVRFISSTMGSLPMHVYRRTDDGGRSLAPRHWAYPMLHDSPNEYHTAFTWRELMMAHVLLWGNSYNRIEWLGNGAAGALLPLMPWDVTPKLTSKGVKYYQVQLSDGKEDLPDDEVLHVPGLSYDGLAGMSVIGKMCDSLGLSKAAEDLAGSFFANGAKVGQIIEVPGKMNEMAQVNLVESLAKKFAGKDGAFKALVLEEGAKLHSTMMPLKDAQFLEIRKFQRSEIFGWYGLPPHLGGDTERSTSWGTGIEQQDIGYAKHTMTPWCVRIEQEINRKLFPRNSGLYCKFSLDALMRGDFQSRMQGLQIAVGGPFLSRAEAREIEDWNKSSEPGMDKVLTPLNMGVGATPAAPAPKPADPPAQE